MNAQFSAKKLIKKNVVFEKKIMKYASFKPSIRSSCGLNFKYLKILFELPHLF